jgi:spore germination cell wall hydrolase CwlJ-like protein
MMVCTNPSVFPNLTGARRLVNAALLVAAAVPHVALAQDGSAQNGLSVFGSAPARIGPASTPLFVRSAPEPDTATAYNPLVAYAPPMVSALDVDSLPASAASRSRALDCLTMAIAYEAGQEPLAGQQAVAQVILNRTRLARFPGSVCGVVFDGAQRTTGCQFTFTCDGSIRRRLRETTLQSARMAALSVLTGQAPDRVNGATHYHANYVNPYWAYTGTRVAQIGAHIFYRMPGDAAGSAAAKLTSEEPEIAALAASRVRALPVRRPRVHVAPGATQRVFAPWGVPMAAAGDASPVQVGQN